MDETIVAKTTNWRLRFDHGHFCCYDSRREAEESRHQLFLEDRSDIGILEGYVPGIGWQLASKIAKPRETREQVESSIQGLIDEPTLLPPFRVVVKRDQGSIPESAFFESPWNAFAFAEHRASMGYGVLVSEYRPGLGWADIATPQEAQRLGQQAESNTILDEAKQITAGDRQASYGPPDQDFARTARIWEAILATCLKDGELRITPRHIALCMIGLKLSRETHQHKRDNWVDIAGYAKCGQDCADCEQARSEAD